MSMLEEIKSKLKKLDKKLSELRVYLDIDKNEKVLKELEAKMAGPGFWDNQEKARSVIKELKKARAVVDPYFECRKEFDELGELIVIVDSDDKGSIDEVRGSLERLEKDVDALEFKSLMSGELDSNDAILSVHSGAGGTESCDWASMLLRMYSMWAEKNKYKTEIIDILPGEGAGVKSAVMIVSGAYAYGYLKSERGVHRLVRISPFDSNKRRHTSFASVDIIAEVEDDIEVDIKESELRIDTYRSSGAGGQHVNVTDSAVRITHLPTNIVVQCQNERSQHKNKATAMKVLKARIYELKLEEKKKEIEKENAKKRKIEWGSQIRSYVMHPYSMVKDHRTDYETSNVNAVMDGALDRFIEAFLKWKARK
ncbi:MAG: peptide chain release factor 2 [Candidatus Omnitrophica bacterium]|nr:peptide chain release factor 2 [Candidatus Omnitrophota bacterium]MBU4589820.1 peptide chain release factor 2 [Candidatus Omnitrophota bacterium]